MVSSSANILRISMYFYINGRFIVSQRNNCISEILLQKQFSNMRKKSYLSHDYLINIQNDLKSKSNKVSNDNNPTNWCSTILNQVLFQQEKDDYIKQKYGKTKTLEMMSRLQNMNYLLLSSIFLICGFC